MHKKYLSKIKRTKIGFLTEIMLIRRGKKDYRDNAVYINKDGFVSSSFIEQEVELCLATIEKEKENLVRIILSFCVDLKNKNTEIDSIKETVGRLSIDDAHTQSDDSLDYKTFKNVSESEIFYSLDNFLSYSEQLAEKSANVGRKEICEKILVKKKQSSNVLKLNIENCFRLSKIRCKHHLHILNARIAAYYRGIFSICEDNSIYFPQNKIDNIIYQSIQEIDNIYNQI